MNPVVSVLGQKSNFFLNENLGQDFGCIEYKFVIMKLLFSVDLSISLLRAVIWKYGRIV